MMGLPLFTTPVEPDEAAKVTDKAAARSRSAIRRQRTIRRGEHSRPEARSVRLRVEGSDASQRQIPDTTARRDAAFRYHSGNREVEEAIRRARIAAQRQRQRDEASDRPSVIQTDRSLTPPGTTVAPLGSVVPPMPPVPEPRDYEGNRGPAQSARTTRNNRLGRENHRSYTTYDTGAYPAPANRETHDYLGTNPSRTQLPALTPNFSPARRYVLEESGDRYEADANPAYRPYRPFFMEPRSPGPLERPASRGSRTIRGSLPPLRQMGRRGIASLNANLQRVGAARLDGLGDRDRSLSVEGDGAWETMLTTLTPDPQLPSASSSFASISAAASAPSNAGSSGTSLTTMSSTPNPPEEMDAVMDHACDLIDEFSELLDTEAEDEDDIYELEEELEVGEATDAGDMLWRSYTDYVVHRADRVARPSGTTDLETLGGMQRIVRGLARREDIPDEWWAEAGLSRNLPREVITIRL